MLLAFVASVVVVEAGVRVNKAGERFDIHDGILWKLIDAQGQVHGQPALIWTKVQEISEQSL